MLPISIGLNHHKTPFELREKTVISEEQLADALVDLRQYSGLDEAIILSTCNRLEIFSFCAAESYQKICQWVCAYHKLDPEQLQGLWHTRYGDQAVAHLIKVACGLDSVIIGEPQILGQVKTAYRIARENQHTDTTLNKMFEHCISVAKKIRSETEIGQHAVSYASVIVNRLKILFDDVPQKRVLIIGAGEVNRLVIKHFQEYGIQSIAITNRTADKAAEVAQEAGITAIDFNKISECLHDYDIVVSCTASTTPILHSEDVRQAMAKRARRPMHISDLAIPRDIDPQVNDIRDVYLHSLDALEKIIRENQDLRLQAKEEALRIVEQGSEAFRQWLQTRAILPLLQDYRQQAEQQAQQSLDLALEQLKNGQSAEQVLKTLSHNLSQKLMHTMTETIKESAAQSDADLAEVLRKVMNKGENS